MIVSAEPNENIDRAHKNIERIKCYTSRNFDVLDIMKLDRVLITKKGLKEMTDNILKSMYLVNKQPYMKNIVRKLCCLTQLNKSRNNNNLKSSSTQQNLSPSSSKF